MTKKILAWHFVAADRRMAYGDREQIEAGKTYSIDKDKLELCVFGLHASKKALDANSFVKGPIVCRVELSGKILTGDDKLCAERRKVLWIADATQVLHLFAIQCAKRALDREKRLGRTPDPRSYAALEAKHKYLNGEIDDATLAATESAAWSAARSAARSAAESAARSAARSAAWSAAESAARSAAESAAESAAWSAARSAELDWQNRTLTKMLLKLKPSKRGTK